ncbi:MAG: hypothetical protein ACREA8_05435, partial [Nitrosotalea sp.]
MDPCKRKDKADKLILVSMSYHITLEYSRLPPDLRRPSRSIPEGDKKCVQATFFEISPRQEQG